MLFYRNIRVAANADVLEIEAASPVEQDPKKLMPMIHIPRTMVICQVVSGLEAVDLLRKQVTWCHPKDAERYRIMLDEAEAEVAVA